jgi:AraC family transcriptional regulator of adaptative response/methylated-DNA-[protein]-cysteine methyltransferase
MTDYERVASVIRYLDAHRGEQPQLGAIARYAGSSASHFHRVFARWAGVTPKAFLQCLTMADARDRLRAGQSVLEAAYDAGLSGPGRLHDLAVRLEAATPGELKSGGGGWTITAGFADTPFGIARAGVVARGFCHLAFVEARDRAAGARAILEDWPAARIEWNDREVAGLVPSLFTGNPSAQATPGLRALVRGTPFQVQVWRALLRIPPGSLASYGAIARAVGRPTASRAVGAAIGRNAIAWLIPCHRVIRETGALGGYRWGTDRKATMMAWERARANVVAEGPPR